jgi:hypothetical protein
MTGAAPARERARECASVLESRTRVCAVDVLDPRIDPTDCWTVELVIKHPNHARTPGVPPEVLAVLADHDLTVRAVTQQGAGAFSVATATA